MNQINVIKLIENDFITRLSRTYESKLIKLKKHLLIQNNNYF